MKRITRRFNFITTEPHLVINDQCCAVYYEAIQAPFMLLLGQHHRRRRRRVHTINNNLIELLEAIILIDL